MRTMRAGMLIAAAALAGCGVTYTSSSVREQAGDVDVRIVALDPQSLLVANRQDYTPRSLPAVFFRGAGGGSLRGLGALPETPYLPDVRREPLELRVPPPVTREPYEIGIGDVVLLATKSAGSTIEELTGLLAAQNQRQGYTVRDDGTISIPDIGQADIAGKTIEEAEAEIFRLLLDNGIDPAFSLEVSEFNSRRVAVGGAVRAPSVVPITLTPLKLGEALAGAGGVNITNEEFATIRIYRDGALYQIPIERFFAQPELQTLPLVNGDAVYVDTTYDLDQALAFYQQQIDVLTLRRDARLTALNELQAEIGLRRAAQAEQRENFEARAEFGAESRDYVYLAGEVAQQSRYAMPYNQQVSLADVLYDSGGLATPTGDPSEIYVLRASPDPAEFSAVTAWHLDAGNAASLTLATKMQMRPNDIVFIEEQPITSWNRALQQAFPTLINTAAASAGN